MTPQRDDEDDEKDASGAYDIGTAPDVDDLDSFEPGEDEREFAGSSSGVSFEELSQTIGVLGKEQPSEAEKQKATSVLYNINGTELFNFIALNETYTEKARALMAAFKEQPVDGRPEGFDMNEYMD